MAATANEMSIEQLRAQLEAIDQAHLLRFEAELDPAERGALLDQIAALPFDRIPEWVETYVLADDDEDVARERIEPPRTYGLADGSWDRAAMREAGEALLRAGRVAAFTVAGGQGSRLGYDGPKGCFPGGAVTGRPLFGCLADWILAARERYGAAIPWYVMTSPLNHTATVLFFDEHGHFGLPPEDVMFFPQGVVPSFDRETGRILLADRGLVATNPDGHGGSLRALAASGAIADMRSRGIEHISYVQIDNPLARVIDPVFLGLHAAARDSSGEMSTKVVAKTEPDEKVGVLCRTNGRTSVIEYSDLPGSLAEARDADGQLRFRAGNIAIHAIGVDFVERLNEGGTLALPFHRAVKKVPCVDLETGARVDPVEPNGVKLEMFVFDALPKCEASIAYEVERVDEFAPIKNAEGKDSPASSRRIQTERAARWLETHGVEVPREADGTPACTLEICPRTAMDPAELAGRDVPAVAAGDRVVV